MRAVFSNQLIVIESEEQPNGAGLLTLTSPVNEPGYMNSLLNAVQEWQPRGGDGTQFAIEDAKIENNQVICSLIPQNGELDTQRLNTVILPGLRNHLEQRTNRSRSATAGADTGDGMGRGGGEEDLDLVDTA